MAQLDLFPRAEEEPVSFAPSIEDVRARIDAVLVRLRSSAPCSAKESALWKVIIPQMANWLPPDERDAKRREFARLIGALEPGA
jgi:hypothetical protein